MYGNQLVIVLCVVGVVWSYSYSNDDLKLIDSIRNEPSCSRQGGMCTVADDCPPGKLTEERGLCPLQRRAGVECCNGISLKETRCQKRGGGCMDWCNNALVEPKATDCPENTKCCILV
ncbi:hypothetical protein PYW07_014181 [Mythimna separata]|uniref:Uncharacterized protein n=1 Tax=Mythimna separata TaxID=271217 RepID=A0AAD8DYT7_MYTSE|nr:hypothetical protein PYW07_014181 [Mythimna separata]